MATARRKATGSARQRGADNRWLDPPGYSLSPAARPAFFIRWRAAEKSAGRGATMATARRKATGSARQRGADNRWLDPPGYSLSPAARPAFFIRWRAAEKSAGRGATMATARRKATGSARQRGADNRWLDPLATLFLRPLGRHSLSVGGPPKNLPVGAPRWRRRDEKLRGQQGNEALTTAG